MDLKTTRPIAKVLYCMSYTISANVNFYCNSNDSKYLLQYIKYEMKMKKAKYLVIFRIFHCLDRWFIIIAI